MGKIVLYFQQNRSSTLDCSDVVPKLGAESLLLFFMIGMYDPYCVFSVEVDDDSIVVMSAVTHALIAVLVAFTPRQTRVVNDIG